MSCAAASGVCDIICALVGVVSAVFTVFAVTMVSWPTC
jgi:hypothetical protein